MLKIRKKTHFNPMLSCLLTHFGSKINFSLLIYPNNCVKNNPAYIPIYIRLYIIVGHLEI